MARFDSGSVWTVPTWRLIHLMDLLTITPQQFSRFLYCVSRLIPCVECSYELGQQLHVASADELHDHVRRRLGQSICSIEEKTAYMADIEQNRDKYFNECMAIYELHYQSLEKHIFIREIRQLYESSLTTL
jgi:hypothetical protein